jgi:hypothetical protein
MWKRASTGRPPVTEAEFDELAGWFGRNESRVDDVIDLGGGRRVSRVNLRYQIGKGSRALDVTELVEDLRLLRGVLGWGFDTHWSGSSPNISRCP